MLTTAERKIEDISKSQTWAPADAILIACFLFEAEMVVKEEMKRVYVELFGFYTRGQVAIERVNTDLRKNAFLIQQANATTFMKYILEAAKNTVSSTIRN